MSENTNFKIQLVGSGFFIFLNKIIMKKMHFA